MQYYTAMRVFFSLLLSRLVLHRVNAFSGEPQSSKNPVKVLVTGAAGQTGRIVMSKLEEDHRYDPKGLFRTERSAMKIVKNDDILCALEHVVVADITSSTFIDDLGHDTNTKSNGLELIEAMIICTSAVPTIKKRSLVAMLVKVPWRLFRGEPAVDVNSMRFKWKHGGCPQKVDYEGQIAQIDLAKKLGIPHVILVSSMGGTDPEHFLNSVGNDDGHGDILLWKRKAEKYLVESGLDYTILHPGNLVDTAGGRNEIVLGVDDDLQNNETDASGGKRAGTFIGREDVANLCIAALSVCKGKNISFDCITVPPTSSSSSLETPPISEHKNNRARKVNNKTASPSSFVVDAGATQMSAQVSTATIPALSETIAKPGKSAEEALRDFLDRSVTTNYDLGP